MKKVQEVGFQVPYQQDPGTRKVISRLLALQFLPAEHIPATFNMMQEKANTERLGERFNYVESTWINSNVWPCISWSVYGLSIRTNNDTEGWHHRFNACVKRGKLQMYQLIGLMHDESSLIPRQLQLVSEGHLQRYQRSKYSSLQSRILNVWMENREKAISVNQLLIRCGQFV